MWRSLGAFLHRPLALSLALSLVHQTRSKAPFTSSEIKIPSPLWSSVFKISKVRAEPKQNHSEQCLCLSQSQTEIQGQKTVSKNQIAGLWCVQSKLKGLQVQKVVCNWKGSLNQCICHDSYRVYINTRRTRLTVTMGFHCPAVSLLVSVTLIRSCIGDVLRTRIA